MTAQTASDGASGLSISVVQWWWCVARRSIQHYGPGRADNRTSMLYPVSLLSLSYSQESHKVAVAREFSPRRISDFHPGQTRGKRYIQGLAPRCDTSAQSDEATYAGHPWT